MVGLDRILGLSSVPNNNEGSSYEEATIFGGKRINWVGTVIDVKQGSWGNTVALSDGKEQTLTDYFLEGIPKGKVLVLSAGEVVRFSGKVDRIEDGILTGYVYLTRADLN